MFVLLLLLWIILNGKINMEIIVTGVLLVATISHLMYRYLGYAPSEPGNLLRKLCWALRFLAIVFVEVLKSGVAVLKFVMEKEIDIQPQIVVFSVPLKSEFLKIILANAYTLTPGTITLHIENDLFYIHAFDYTFGEDVVDSIMLKTLIKMEKDLEAHSKKEEMV
ncbi:MAG: Na+/H+ antiporter subunit E [Eubacteriales bacterium]